MLITVVAMSPLIFTESSFAAKKNKKTEVTAKAKKSNVVKKETKENKASTKANTKINTKTNTEKKKVAAKPDGKTGAKALAKLKAKKGPRKISITFDEGKPADNQKQPRGPASVAGNEALVESEKSESKSEAVSGENTPSESESSAQGSESKMASQASEKEISIQTHQGSCSTSQDESGWHLPVEENSYSCTLSGRNKPTDPSRGLGFFVNKKNLKVYSMTEGEVIGVVGELMGCKVIVKPSRCPANMKDDSCDITYTIPNQKKNAANECVLPGIKVGTQLKSCQKIADVKPSESFNLVRIETSAQAPLQEVIKSYKSASKSRKQCSKDKNLLALSFL